MSSRDWHECSCGIVRSKTWSDCDDNDEYEEAATICEESNALFIGIYGALGFGYSLMVFFASIFQAFGGIAASARFHKNMLATVIRAPMSFFDTTPMGRIVNRFTRRL